MVPQLPCSGFWHSCCCVLGCVECAPWGQCPVRPLGPGRCPAGPSKQEMESVGAAGLASAEFQFCSLAFVSSRREPHQLALI